MIAITLIAICLLQVVHGDYSPSFIDPSLCSGNETAIPKSYICAVATKNNGESDMEGFCYKESFGADRPADWPVLYKELCKPENAVKVKKMTVCMKEGAKGAKFTPADDAKMGACMNRTFPVSYGNESNSYEADVNLIKSFCFSGGNPVSDMILRKEHGCRRAYWTEAEKKADQECFLQVFKAKEPEDLDSLMKIWCAAENEKTMESTIKLIECEIAASKDITLDAKVHQQYEDCVHA